MLILFFVAAVLGPTISVVMILEANPLPSPIWRDRVTTARTQPASLWAPHGHWRSIAGPNRVTAGATVTDKHTG